MRRAKTITGLLLQALRTRWAGLGNRAKTAVIVGMVLATAAAVHFGACLFGACPASPCGSEASPCELRSAAQDDGPCPFSRARAEREAAAAASAATAGEAADRPCHAE